MHLLWRQMIRVKTRRGPKGRRQAVKCASSSIRCWCVLLSRTDEHRGSREIGSSGSSYVQVPASQPSKVPFQLVLFCSPRREPAVWSSNRSQSGCKEKPLHYHVCHHDGGRLPAHHSIGSDLLLTSYKKKQNPSASAQKGRFKQCIQTHN